MTELGLLAAEDLWHKLAHTDCPIVMYGMGSGADKILTVLSEKNIEVSDFFASDGFVRGHFFHGKRVLSFAEICEKYERFLVLLAFGSSLPDVMEKIRKAAEKAPLFAPDVPVCGNTLFDGRFYLQNKDKIDKVRSLFADERSKEVYDAVLAYKLTGDISFLSLSDSPKEEALSKLLHGGYTAYVDLGAYTGDTAKEALSHFPTIRKLTAFEPSPKVFAKLEGFLSCLDGVETAAFPLCAWDRTETRILTDGAGRNTSLFQAKDAPKAANGAKLRSVACGTLDSAVSLKNERLLIKYDVEGAEKEALLGSKATIADSQTEMIVSLYHRSEDLFELPLLVHELMPEKKLYLRKHPYIPAWDINLYVTF